MTLLLPDAPAIVAGAGRVTWLEPDGEIETLTPELAAMRLRQGAALFCHRRATAQRLGLQALRGFDLLELFAFARPATFTVPTARGVAQSLGIVAGSTPEDEALSLQRSAAMLLGDVAAQRRDADMAGLLAVMAAGGWDWAPFAGAALGLDATVQPAKDASVLGALAVWRRLKEWSDRPAENATGDRPVEPAAARRRLAELLGSGAEARPQQADFASAVSGAFARRQQTGRPTVLLAEAGTGVGKTLGYIAPASLWAEANEGTVLVSTYTRNLQQQIDRELDRLYPDANEKRQRVVVRKGRENYLCLLNYEAAVASLATRSTDAVLMGLLARWAAATATGDLAGGDLPGWLPELFGRGRVMSLTDRRGECTHSACPHYRVCFVEKTIRRARHASLIIANHALVLAHAPQQLAASEAGQAGIVTRFIFDEGHHLFDAADKAFALTLSGRSAADLRRWLIGPERAGRMRGLARRLGDLVTEDGAAALTDILVAAHELPGEGWLGNLAENRPQRATETFLAQVRRQVYARAAGTGPDQAPDQAVESAYGLECATDGGDAALLAAAAGLEAALGRIEAPLRSLARHLAAQLEEDEGTLERGTRQRLDMAGRSLLHRADGEIAVWRSMLRALAGGGTERGPRAYLDRFAIERSDGRDLDVALERRWIDPTRPLAETVLSPAHGVVVTSATLTDSVALFPSDPLLDIGEEPAGPASGRLLDWDSAERRSGTIHLERPAVRARMPSPYDYAAQTRIMVVSDVRRSDPGQVAGAYRALIAASRGGALGLFTSVQRLRAVHARIAADLEARRLPLLAQHVDGMDVGTLIDIFRAEEESSLLGTDAVRDGVDVPGRSLRLIVYDRVPWPRPDLIHRARRAAFGGRAYDDLLTRLRLKQAYGRLIRRADDRGVFVLLDSGLPTRLATAFPEGVAVERVSLRDAVEGVATFLGKLTANGDSRQTAP